MDSEHQEKLDAAREIAEGVSQEEVNEAESRIAVLLDASDIISSMAFQYPSNLGFDSLANNIRNLIVSAYAIGARDSVKPKEKK